jgi:RND family efflux transporter MFP subunit
MAELAENCRINLSDRSKPEKPNSHGTPAETADAQGPPASEAPLDSAPVGSRGRRFAGVLAWLQSSKQIVPSRVRSLSPGKLLGFAAAAVIAGGIFLVFTKGKQAKDRTDPAAARAAGRPIPVRTDSVREVETDIVVGATAVTMPSFGSVIRIPPTGGLSVRYVPAVTDMVVKAVHVEEGQFVRKGQLLFETDHEFYAQVLEQRISAVAAYEAQIATAQRAIELNRQIRQAEETAARKELEFRTQDLETRKQSFDLVKKNRSSSEAEYLEAKSNFDRAVYAIEEAKQRLSKAKDALALTAFQDKEDLNRAIKERDLAQVDYEETRRGVARGRITSPIDGYIDSRIDVVPGQTVEVTTALARVLQIDPIYVKVDFPQERMGDVRPGLHAEVVLDSFPGETFRGTVLRSSAQVNSQLRVFPVIVSVPNPDHRIRCGVSGFARIHNPGKRLVVPETAILRSGAQASCFRIENGHAKLREVKIGRPLDVGFLEIRDGLSSGDEVVVYHSNIYRQWGHLGQLDAYLKDGDLIDPNWRRWARDE